MITRTSEPATEDERMTQLVKLTTCFSWRTLQTLHNCYATLYYTTLHNHTHTTHGTTHAHPASTITRTPKSRAKHRTHHNIQTPQHTKTPTYKDHNIKTPRHTNTTTYKHHDTQTPRHTNSTTYKDHNIQKLTYIARTPTRRLHALRKSSNSKQYSSNIRKRFEALMD